MKPRMLFPSAVLLVTALAALARAEVKDPAELVPAGTLAYLELNQPGQTGKDLAALMKGSALDDLPAVITKFREKAGDWDTMFTLTPFGAFFGPEVLAEMARIQGGAVALTGFTKGHEPEVVGFVLSGDSNAPGFLMRAFLTAYPWMHSAGEVEGVRLYRERSVPFQRFAPGGQPPPKADPRGPTYAMMPGLVIIGSTTDSVKNVILRARGKGTGATLASVSEFKEAAKLRERPGLFGYASPAALTDLMAYWVAESRPAPASRPDADAPPPAKPDGDAAKRDEGDEAAIKTARTLVGRILDTTVNSEAVRAVAASLTLRNGDVDLQAQLLLDPKQTSPLLELLPDKPASPELLHAVPRGSLFVVTHALPDGEKRWENFLKLVDATAKAAGGPEAPSKMVKAAEEKLGLQFGKDVFGKISGLALAVPGRWETPKGGVPLPMLTIGATDEDAAKSLEEVIPKLISLASRDEISPSGEEIDGQRIRSLPGNDLPWRSAVHYGRHGSTLVIGQDRKQVAAALSGAAKKEGLLADARVATAIKNVEAPVILGVWSAGPTLVQAMHELTGPPRPGPRIGVKPPADVGGGGGGGGGPPGPARKKGAPAAQKPAEKYAQELAKVADSLSPVVITVNRKPEQLSLGARQAALKSVSAKLIDAGVDWMLDLSLLRRGGFGLGGAVIEEAVPVIEKP